MSIILSIHSSKPNSIIYFGIGGEVYPRFSADHFEIEFINNLFPFSNKSRQVTISEGIMVTKTHKRMITSILLENRYTVKWLDSSFLGTFAAGLKSGLVLDLCASTVVPVYDWTVLYHSSVLDYNDLEGDLTELTSCGKAQNLIGTAIKKCLQKCPIDTRLDLARNILIVGGEMGLDKITRLEAELNTSNFENGFTSVKDEVESKEMGIENGVDKITLNNGETPDALQYKVIKTCYHPRLISWTGASLLADVKGISIGKECKNLNDLTDWTQPEFEE